MTNGPFNVFLHCARNVAGLHARRICASFMCQERELLVTSDLAQTLHGLKRPFLLLAHEARAVQWDNLYRALHEAHAPHGDWAVIRFSMGGPGDLPAAAPESRNLAILRSGLTKLLDHLDEGGPGRDVLGFRESVANGQPNFRQLCRKVPDLEESNDVDALHRWLATAEAMRSSRAADPEADQYLADLHERAANTLSWLAEAFGVGAAQPVLTPGNAQHWLQRAQQHPRLDYPD